MEPRDFARSGFEWDTDRRPSQVSKAPVDWLKVFLWTLVILIFVPAILAGIGALACLLLLFVGS